MQPDVLPFGDASFDSVILDNVLEHIVNPKALLGEVHRVLRSSGNFVVGVPGTRGYASDDDHKVFYDEAGLIACMTGAGLSTKRVHHTPVRSNWLDHNMRQYCLYGVFVTPT